MDREININPLSTLRSPNTSTHNVLRIWNHSTYGSVQDQPITCFMLLHSRFVRNIMVAHFCGSSLVVSYQRGLQAPSLGGAPSAMFLPSLARDSPVLLPLHIRASRVIISITDRISSLRGSCRISSLRGSCNLSAGLEDVLIPRPFWQIVRIDGHLEVAQFIYRRHDISWA